MNRIEIKIGLKVNYIHIAEAIYEKIKEIIDDDLIAFDNCDAFFGKDELRIVITSRFKLDIKRLSLDISDYFKSNVIMKSYYRNMDISLK